MTPSMQNQSSFLPSILIHACVSAYSIKSAAAPAAAPTPAPATSLLPAPALVAEAFALPVVEAAVAWATCTPKEVLVLAVPETVVVTTLVAVVEAWHPDQVVQGASLAQDPLVQPDQVEAGQALLPHQEVQGAAVHEPEEVHCPQPLLFPLLPNGPTPLPADQPWPLLFPLPL